MRIDHHSWWSGCGRRVAASVGIAAAVAAGAPVAAEARGAIAPQNNAAPTVIGAPRENNTLTAGNGTWTNAPTMFTYQWQLCGGDGSGCADIAGATTRAYGVKSGDVDHTLRVAVTAANADGQATADSATTSVVSGAKAPTSTAPPTITGTPKVGEALTASNGTWTGGVQSFAYQWQQCDSAGANCASIADATSRSYGVRTVDVGKTIRVLVTAKNAVDSTTTPSAATTVVAGIATTTTATTATTTTTTATTTTTPAPPPVRRNRAPAMSFVSLKRFGPRAYVRFRTCDDSARPITVIASDLKARVRVARHRFTVAGRPCVIRARSWRIPARFRTHGRYTVTLRAVDRSGASSRTVGRSLHFR